MDIINHSKPRLGGIKIYVILGFLIAMLYWPLTTGTFALKNDALTYFLPYRYNISEAIQNGHFPFWSPFIYTGLPLHADMQSGVWNPLVWLLSASGKYSLTTLHWETIIYYFIAGYGIIKLAFYFNWHPLIALTLAISYTSSGFMLDSSSFIPWVASAAYLPICLLYFLRFRTELNFKASLKLAVALWLLFSSGYPSILIFTGYLILTICLTDLVQLFFSKNTKKEAYIYLKFGLASLFIFLSISSPAILSYYDFLPYYQRGIGTSIKEAQFNSFEIQHVSSYIFSPASYKLKGLNDISGRNAYFGIVLVIFIIFSLKKNLEQIQKFLIAVVLITLLFSFGPDTPVRKIFYDFVPLMNTFRHPSSIRVFTILGLILLAGFGMHNWFTSFQKYHLTNSVIVTFFLTITAFFIFFFLFNDYSSFAIPNDLTISTLKKVLDKSSAISWLFIVMTVQMGTLAITWIKLNSNKIFYISIANCFLISWLAMPFTLISQFNTKQVNSFVRPFADDYPLDSMRLPILKSGGRIFKDKFGYTAFYEKRLSIQKDVYTPTINTAYNNFLANTQLMETLAEKPIAFADHEESAANLYHYTPNSFHFQITSNKIQNLNFIQQFNTNWRCYIDGKNVKISQALEAFISVPINPGLSKIEFVYRPQFIVNALMLAVLTVLCSLIYLIFTHFKTK